MAWRTASGSFRGFRESYQNEIAAYELDKLLKMDMVPPTVERQIDGRTGAAQRWVENVIDATDPTLPTGESRTRWASEQVRMTMFDNLIGNRDRNRRNMLRDQMWHLILIDHTRAFSQDAEAPDWSPDASLLYFWSDRDGSACLWAQRLDSITKRPTREPLKYPALSQ